MQEVEFNQQTWTFKTRQCGRSRVSTTHVCVGLPISQPSMGKESGMDLYNQQEGGYDLVGTGDQ